MPSIRANGITLEYDSFGDSSAEVLLLISGLGTQMIRWTEPFCSLLTSKGFRVVRFDNRDAGLSTHLAGARVPDISATAMAMAQGRQPDVPYTLVDMADDAAEFISALNLGRVHVIGRSMGGVIAQLLASHRPDLVRTLTVIMSSTCNPALPPPTPAALQSLMARSPDPSVDEAAYIAHKIEAARVIASPGFPFDEASQREIILAELKRGFDPAGAARQIGALIATGNCRAKIQSISAPTLVIHGDNDILISPASGLDIANNIAGAKMMTIKGMGHDIPSPLFARIVDTIFDHTQRAKIDSFRINESFSYLLPARTGVIQFP